MRLDQLETPALIADEQVMNENMKEMEKLLQGKVLKLRPHYKSNKCAAIAMRQIKDGAVGITCAKLSEALDLVDAGIEDVLIANQIVDPGKISQIATLAGKCHLTVCVDNFDNADALSAAAVAAGTTIYCYVEYEIGMNRCGVTDEMDYVRLARHVSSLPNLEYAGIQAYAGHVSHMVSKEEREHYTKSNGNKIRNLIGMLKEEGIEVKAVSGGSTGSSVQKAEEGLYTELQAGSYFFMDSTYNKLEDIPFKNSLFVLATVVSKREGLTILDAGVKSLGVDQGLPEVLTLEGKPVKAELEINEEHLKLFDADTDLSIGDRVLLIPGHCCSTVNLHEKIYLYRDGKVTGRLQISARGQSV